MAEKDKNFTTPIKPTWCAGCGNFMILAALKQALVALGIEPHEAAMTFDIGCSGNSANWHRLYSFHALHGRSLPVALGIKLANPDLKVIADAGDGGGYGEGGNHFLHACQANIDVTFLVHNNKSFSLTKGQSSPTSEEEYISSSTPFGLKEVPLNPLQLAIVSGASFVARGYAGEMGHLAEVIKEAISHKGFALVDVLQPCPIFNKQNTFDWYKERVYKLENWDAQDKEKAVTKAGEWDKKIPIGVFYKKNARSFSHAAEKAGYKNAIETVKARDIQDILREFS